MWYYGDMTKPVKIYGIKEQEKGCIFSTLSSKYRKTQKKEEQDEAKEN